MTEPGRVMTPRPASEQLVAAALARLEGRPARVADVGTGSGAIAIAIARAAPEAEVWAPDAGAERLTRSGGVVIQLHRRVLQAGRDELSDLRSAIEEAAATARATERFAEYPVAV